jgi:hypothetical protein
MDGKIILNCILNEGAWIWLRVGDKWRTLVNTEMNFWVLKMQRIFG